MWNIYLITALIAATLGAAGTYRIEEWRFAAKELAHEQQALADEQSASKATLRRAEAVLEAQNAAARRMAAARRDADSARNALAGLHNASTSALQSAATNPDACPDRATTASELLDQCAAKYQELGEQTDRHVSDIRTLMEAWPR